MKKLAAILLLSLLLFNLVGYKLLFLYLQHQKDQQFQTYLNKEAYNEDDLITIKVPLSMPYQANWTDFERIDGEVSFNGKIYKYVKRKVTNGELILLCLPDYNKTRVVTAKDNFFKLANSLQANVPVKKPVNSSTASINNVISEFDNQYNEWLLQAYYNFLKYAYPVNESFSVAPLYNLITHPPEAHKV